MKMLFETCTPESLKGNPFDMIGSQWMLITAGSPDSWNTMTASWGGMGVLWEQDVMYVFVRPTRHTNGFMQQNDFFTCSFFAEEYRDALNYCGAKSGRDVDKARHTGLIPLETKCGSVGFEQAELIIECQKLHQQQLDPAGFVTDEPGSHYPKKDYHILYVGRIVNCYIKQRS